MLELSELGLDFVYYWNNDGCVAGGIEKDMRDVGLDFFFEDFEVGIGLDGFVGFGTEIMANFAD